MQGMGKWWETSTGMSGFLAFWWPGCSLTGMICFFWEHVSQHVPWQGTEHGVWCPRREILGRNPSQKWTFAVWQEGNFIGPLIEAPKKHFSVRFPSTSWSWGFTSCVWHRSGSAHSTRAARHSNSEESLCTMGTAGPVFSSWWMEIPLVGGCL